MSLLVKLACLCCIAVVSRGLEENTDKLACPDFHKEMKDVVKVVQNLSKEVGRLTREMKKCSCERRIIEDDVTSVPASLVTTPPFEFHTTTAPKIAGDSCALDQPFQFLHVKIRNGDNRNYFTITYSALTRPSITVTQFQHLVFYISQPVSFNTDFKDGIGTINVTSAMDNIRVNLDHCDLLWTASLSLKVNNETSGWDVPKLKMKTNAKRKLVFEKHQSVDFWIKTYSPTMRKRDVVMDLGVTVINQSDPNTLVYASESYDRDGILHEVLRRTQTQNFTKSMKTTIRINPEEEDIEGLVKIRTTIFFSDPSPILYTALIRRVSFHREGHQPFPDDFLGFYGMDKSVSCEIGQPCSFKTTVVCTSCKEIMLWKVNNGTNTLRVADQTNSRRHPYFLVTMFTFDRATKDDMGHYIFRGESLSGKIIEQNMYLNITKTHCLLKVPGVLNDSPDKLVVECKVTGYPKADVKFFDNSRFSYFPLKQFVNGINATITTDIDDADVTTAVMTLKGGERNVALVYCGIGNTLTMHDYQEHLVYQCPGTITGISDRMKKYYQEYMKDLCENAG